LSFSRTREDVALGNAAAVANIDGSPQRGQFRLVALFLALQGPQRRRTHYFTSVLVAPALNLGQHEAVELIGQIDATGWHCGSSSQGEEPGITTNSKVCQLIFAPSSGFPLPQPPPYFSDALRRQFWTEQPSSQTVHLAKTADHILESVNRFGKRIPSSGHMVILFLWAVPIPRFFSTGIPEARDNLSASTNLSTLHSLTVGPRIVSFIMRAAIEGGQRCQYQNWPQAQVGSRANQNSEIADRCTA
jgi:hypothetical protein